MSEPNSKRLGTLHRLPRSTTELTLALLVADHRECSGSRLTARWDPPDPAAEVSMDEPVQVSVVALDPVLEVGVKGILCRSPDVALVLPHEVARVAVVVVRSAA